MLGAFVALVGLVVFLNWPEGKADNIEWVDDEVTAKRVKKAPAPEVEAVVRRRRDAEAEEESDASGRRKRLEVDQPIRRGSKKPTAKKAIAPAA